MSNLPAERPVLSPEESALIQGDLSKLTPQQCVSLYEKVCLSAGLNPLQKPFEYLFLNGRKILYAKKDATDQLRKINGVSIDKVDTKIDGHQLETIVYGHDKTGRTDCDMGVVDITGLRGVDLANAKMKCLTKAKRRFTLSISGLGIIDESELEDIPSERKVADFNNDPFGKKQEAIDSAKDVTQAEPASTFADELIDGPPDLGAYVVKIGKKFKGQALRDIDPFELNNYLNWLNDDSKKTGKPLSADAAELAQYGEAYLASMETK